MSATHNGFQPPLIPVATIAFLGMAALLGAVSGADFAFVGKLAPVDKVGTVTGVIGAAGGLGGFIPPLIMGWVFGVEGSYAIGLMLLSDVAWPRPSTPPSRGAASLAAPPERS